MRKRSVTIHGHQTSISLEDEFWDELATIAGSRQLSLNALVTEVDKARGAQKNGSANLSSALRIYVALARASGDAQAARAAIAAFQAMPEAERSAYDEMWDLSRR